MNNHTLRMQRTIFKHSNKQVFGNTDSNETRTINYRTNETHPTQKKSNLGENEISLIVIHASILVKDKRYLI